MNNYIIYAEQIENGTKQSLHTVIQAGTTEEAEQLSLKLSLSDWKGRNRKTGNIGTSSPLKITNIIKAKN